MDLVAIFKLLSDQTRLRVIALIAQEELCVCELCGILDKPQPQISKILAKLRDMNLVIDERKDKYIFYSLKTTNPLLNHILEFINQHQEEHPILISDYQRLQVKANYVDQCLR